ncbi:MAG: hypothetical protein U0930_11170 [Pirellulales bacterium]
MYTSYLTLGQVQVQWVQSDSIGTVKPMLTQDVQKEQLIFGLATYQLRLQVKQLR